MTQTRLHLAAILVFTTQLAAAQFIGPQASTQTTPPPAAPTTHADTLTLLSGDLCNIQVYDVPNFDFKARINDAGDLTLPVAGTLHLAGLDIASAEKLIAARLIAADYIKSPQVSLLVLDSPNHFVTVTGEVRTPGPVPVYGEKRLLDVLSAAGGLTPASSPQLTIYHRGSTDPVLIHLPADPAASGQYNIPVLPGDNIIVSKVGVVYVIGAFHQQGAIPLKNTTPLTLIEAMSLAGGVNYEAAMNKAYILRATGERRGGDGRREIPFNVSSVLKHKVPDPVLQNDDIVLVPSNDMKAALKGGAASVGAALVGGVGYLVVR